MLKKEFRIKDKKSIDKVFKYGRAKGSDFFLIKFIENRKDHPEVAIVISSKVSKKSVLRNKLKRQISETIRINFDKFNKNVNLIIIVSPKALGHKFSEISENLIHLLEEAKIIR